jgi:vesicle coat complex subunit
MGSDTRRTVCCVYRCVQLMTIGRDVSSFFPDVVKNVVVDVQEVKKLVYMYLIAYAESNPELALLSINTFQKDLSSHNQRTRGNAMKAMSSIRIPVVIPLVTLALKTAVKDTSPYVRKAAACAIPKVFGYRFSSPRTPPGQSLHNVRRLTVSLFLRLCWSAVWTVSRRKC